VHVHLDYKMPNLLAIKCLRLGFTVYFLHCCNAEDDISTPNAPSPNKPSSIASLSPAPALPVSEEHKRAMRQHQQIWLKASMFRAEVVSKNTDAQRSQLPGIHKSDADRHEDELR
jgi:hypothetical protein